MHRLTIGVLAAMFLSLSFPAAMQQTSQPPADEFAAGGNCSGRSEASKGDCAKYQMYIRQGGKDATCKRLFEEALALDDQIAALSSRQNENSNPRLSQEQGRLAQRLATVENQVELRCRTGQRVPDGGKTMVRSDKPQAPPRPLDGPLVVAAIDRCVREQGRMTYYTSPRITAIQGFFGGYVTDSKEIRYNPASLARDSTEIRAIWFASAFAHHVLELEKRQHNERRAPADYLQMHDWLTGFLTHCLELEGFLPTTPDDMGLGRAQLFAQFVREGQGDIVGDPPTPRDPATIQMREANFDFGWSQQGMGFPFEMRK